MQVQPDRENSQFFTSSPFQVKYISREVGKKTISDRFSLSHGDKALAFLAGVAGLFLGIIAAPFLFLYVAKKLRENQIQKLQQLGPTDLKIQTVFHDLDDLPKDLPDHHKFQAARQTRILQGKGPERENAVIDERSIKQNLFSEATEHHYGHLPVDLHGKTIVLTGHVHSDGVGDYYHITAAAEQIKKDYPDANIQILVFTMAKEPPAVIKILDPEKFETKFAHFLDVPEQMLEQMKAADFVLEMSQRTPKVQELEKVLGNKFHFIGEYGHPSHPAMGMAASDMGIFIKDKPESKSLLDLQNPLLKKVMFGTENPSPADLAKYLDEHLPFVGYLKIGSFYQMGLVYTVVAYQEKSSTPSIDLFIPSVPVQYLDREFLKKHGIGSIKVIKKEGDNVTETVEKLADAGKELRLIDLFPVAQSDFQKLVLHAHPLVGCTGDHSLSEVESFDRWAFYEQRPMKSVFWSEMITLAGYVGSEPHYLKQYFEALGEIYGPAQEPIIQSFAYPQLDDRKTRLEFFEKQQPYLAKQAEKIAELLRQPEFAEEIKEFNALLRNQFNFNLTLQEIVQRQFALARYPELRDYENKLQKDYFEGRKSLKAVSELLKQRILSLAPASR